MHAAAIYTLYGAEAAVIPRALEAVATEPARNCEQPLRQDGCDYKSPQSTPRRDTRVPWRLPGAEALELAVRLPRAPRPRDVTSARLRG
jgi:hypothetical protein